MRKPTKKELTKFLIIAYIFNFIGFGGIIINDINFQRVFRDSPLGTGLFVIGTLVPGLIGLYFVYKNNKDAFKTEKFNIISILFMLFFLLVHITLYNLMGDFQKVQLGGNLLLRVIIMIILFGIQEFAWIDIVYDYYEEEKGIYRSMIIVGLFKAIGFFPLTLLPGFLVGSHSYAYFAAFLIGISAMSIFLKKISRNFYISVLFVGLIYGIMSYTDLNQGIIMFLIMFIECIIVYAFGGFIKKD